MDEQTRNVVKDMYERFESVIKEVTQSNERQFMRLIDNLEKQDKRVADLLDRMDKRIESHEERHQDETVEWCDSQKTIQTMVDQFRGMMKDVNDRNDRQLAKIKKCFEVSAYVTDSEDQNLGTSLMDMVNERKQELHDKYDQLLSLESQGAVFNDSVTGNNFPLIN